MISNSKTYKLNKTMFLTGIILTMISSLILISLWLFFIIKINFTITRVILIFFLIYHSWVLFKICYLFKDKKIFIEEIDNKKFRKLLLIAFYAFTTFFIAGIFIFISINKAFIEKKEDEFEKRVKKIDEILEKYGNDEN